MRRIKVGLKDVPLPDQIQTGRLVITSLTNNPNFPNAGPVREQLLVATNELTGSFNDAQSARMLFTAKVSAQNQKAAKFKQVMSQVACWVANQSGSDVTKVLSAGFDLKRGNTRLGPLPAPTAFEVWPDAGEGTVDLFWARVHGAKSYTIQYARAEGEALRWVQATFSTTMKVSVNRLTSGQKYWFRVAAIGAAGQSAWSTPVAKVAA